jgi:two-component system, chemotaxis family, chemotaxis protein CheY
MVIDDSFTLRQVLLMTLTKEGYEVVEAQDGADALRKLAGKKVDMFICDINMPNMDGLTFLRELGKLKEYAYTPKIMLTTESEQTKIQEGKTLGAKAWVVKPFKPDVMLGAIKKLMRP